VTQWGYVYDAAGNRTRKTSTTVRITATTSCTARKSTARLARGRTTLYGYDPVGNRLREQVDSNVTSYTYNEKNQLLPRWAADEFGGRSTSRAW
jgi:hypothetical protein